MPSWGLLKYIETRVQTISFYLKCFFLKKKTVSLPHLLHDFWRKTFVFLYLNCCGKRDQRDKTPFQNAVKFIFYLNGIIVIRTDSLETQAELAVLRTYVENQAILEPILLYRASKCK